MTTMDWSTIIFMVSQTAVTLAGVVISGIALFKTVKVKRTPDPIPPMEKRKVRGSAIKYAWLSSLITLIILGISSIILFFEITSDDPLTRFSVFVIAFQTVFILLAITASFLFVWLYSLHRAVDSLTNKSTSQINSTTILMQLMRVVLKKIKTTA